MACPLATRADVLMDMVGWFGLDPEGVKDGVSRNQGKARALLIAYLNFTEGFTPMSLGRTALG